MEKDDKDVIEEKFRVRLEVNYRKLLNKKNESSEKKYLIKGKSIWKKNMFKNLDIVDFL